MYHLILIRNTVTDEEIKLVPKAVESCMNPGTFTVTPIERKETEAEICFSIGKQRVTVAKEDLGKGVIVINEEPFTPEIIRRKGACKPCTNCGRCSW